MSAGHHGVQHEEAVVLTTLPQRLRPLVRLLAPERRLIGLSVLAGVAHQMLSLALAGTSAWVVGSALTGSTFEELRSGLVVLAALVVPVAVAPWLDSLLAHIAAFRILVHVRGLVYAAFERLAPGYLIRRRSGDLGATAIGHVEYLERFYAHTISPLVVACTVPAASVVALTFLHWQLPVVLTPVLVALLVVPVRMRARATREADDLRRQVSSLSAEAVDLLQGLRELVTFGARRRQLVRFAEQDEQLHAAKSAQAARSGSERALTDALVVAGMLGVVVVASLLVIQGELDTALLPVAVVVASASFAPMLVFLEVLRPLHEAGAAAERVNEILGAEPTVTDPVDTAPPGPLEARIRFDDVSFRYLDDGPDVVRDVSFEVAPGETVALVGHSGAGKSTCAHLLFRLWDVRAGRVTLGGHDVRDFPQDDLRELLTLVPQDVYLFNISLRDNIRLGRPDATDAEVEEAARVALADGFIRALPHGYDTVTGELGGRLSGGQRQRIAIARALLKDAPVLVLDEAVSSLDAASEREVSTAMARAGQGRTTLVIAHRLSTIRAADRVVLLQQGEVLATGSHPELLRTSSQYVDLVRSQLDPSEHVGVL